MVKWGLKMKKWRSLVVFFLLVAGASAVGAFAHPDRWYTTITKPAFTPPDAVFPLVWTLLYAFMAIAAWRVYRRYGVDRSILLWGSQLAVNATWSPIFFRAHAIGWAFADILLLLVLAALTTYLFLKRDKAAGLMMAAYVAWVAFAATLTLQIFRLN